MEKSVGFIGKALHFRNDVLIALFKFHPDIWKDIRCPSEIVCSFVKSLMPKIGTHHGDQYHKIPILHGPLFQTVNTVRMPEVMDSGTVTTV